MRIAELSRRSGVAVPTIKFYLREGILPPGERTSPNQARYDDSHVRRLRLVRAMIELGGLSVAAVHDILATVDSPTDDLDKLMGTVSKGLTQAPEEVDEAALDEVVALIEDMGWTCTRDHPAARSLAMVYTAAREIDHPQLIAGMRRYAEACEVIARTDLDYVANFTGIDRVLEGVVVGTVLGDSALAALRKLAQTAESHRRYGPDDPVE
ncbi:MerR family transcriptional regulator [Actinokineospora xionganensis]|uniref:MerR family transcriptional regulator n=1 Tax=Actinokineospora xionganensis TaxID=2684470 RepID=A0ABR7L6Z5_9PSEU|nr:MerR family transcriptional regulator [Actinokineospora xionganensis]MBC6448469.1 MerR family transcriptional regulator [Actinokineospora xionganensis]